MKNDINEKKKLDSEIRKTFLEWLKIGENYPLSL